MTLPDTRWWRALWASAVLLLANLPALAREFPEHIEEIRLRDVMWQELPPQVRGVYVDPHDRVWYELERPAQRADLAAVRVMLKREFSQAAPQLCGAYPVLFEADGRVWFVSGATLLGYDGKDLIEKSADGEHFFPGVCPNHGGSPRRGYNLFVDGTAFFLESHGVLVCSKGEWSYQPMSEVPPFKRRPFGYPVMCVEPDGKGVTALMLDGGGSSLWRWRAGTWRKIPLPAGIAPEGLVTFAPGPDGVWLFTKAGAVYHTYRNTDAVAPAPGQGVAFGPYQLSQPQLALYDGHATLYVTAAGIAERGRALGPGVVIGQRDGTWRAVLGSGFPRHWGSNSTDDSGPLVLESGKRIWLPMCSDGTGPGLLDIDAKKITQPMPDPRMFWLHAVKSDGTVFVGRSQPGQALSAPVMAFNPSARDDRSVLSSERLELAGSQRAWVSSDGEIWAEVPRRGLLKFDGKQWDEVVGAPAQEVREEPEPSDGKDVRGTRRAPADVWPGVLRDIRSFLPGNSGAVIINADRSWLLLVEDKLVQRSSAQGLIAECAADIIRFYKGGRDAALLGVVPDGHGNIWLRTDMRHLSVLVNGQWLDATGTLKEAGSRMGEAEYVGLCGNGGRVYVTDFMLAHDGGSSHFGEVKDGRVRFSPAPHATEPSFLHLNVRDDSGALWVPGSVRVAGGTADWIRGQVALRVMEQGIAQELPNAGWAKLKDESGNVWLGAIRGKDEHTFNIWRDGKIVHTLAVPGASEHSALVSDKPGSVYVWTGTGLRHLVAKDPTQPGAYSLGALHAVKGIEGSEQGVTLSRLGFLAVTTYSDRGGPRRYYLYVVRLPQANAAD